jgi:GNAT superfamily N-acetyltransferase
MLATRGRVDTFWSNTFDLSTTELHLGGVRVHPHRPSRGGWREAYVLRFEEAAWIFAPTEYVQPIAARFATSTASDAMDPNSWLGVPRVPVSGVVGPSRHHYLDDPAPLRSRVDPPAAAALPARRLNPGDFAALSALRAAVDPAEWTQVSFDAQPPVMFGLFHADTLVAAANLMPGPDAASDVSVVTRPQLRGAGYGTRIAATAAGQALAMHGIARCRALAANHAALTIAAKLGFEEYGQSLSVQLAG